MRTPYEVALRYPRATLLAGVIVTLAMAPGMLRLRLRTDGHALVPPEAPAVQVNAGIRHEFGLDDPVVVVIRPDGPGGVFNPHTVRLIDELTTAFQKLEGVRPERVLSLATEASDRVWPGTLKFRRLLEPLPKDNADLARLRTDLRQIRLYNGTFISNDESAVAIMVGVAAGEDRLEILRRIQETVAGHGPTPERIDIIGAPVAEALLGTHILEDLGVPSYLLGFSTFEDSAAHSQQSSPLPGEPPASGGAAGNSAPPDAQPPNRAEHREASPVRDRLDGLAGSHDSEILRSAQKEGLGDRTGGPGKGTGGPAFDNVREWIARRIGLVPVALAVMAAVFYACFRSIAATMLPLMEVGASLVFVFGLMGLLDVPIYLTTAVLPIILTATGITDEIHVFSRYRHLLRENPQQDHVEVVRATMGELARPIIMTSVTTGIGFLSFASSTIRPVQAFGLFTGIGSIFCMLWSITVIPACFVLLSPRRFVGASCRVRGGPSLGERALHVLGRGIVRWRLVVLIVAVGGVALTPLGIRRVVIQDSWIDGFAQSSAFHQATQRFNNAFLGVHVLLLAVDAGHGVLLTGEAPAAEIQAGSFRLPSPAIPEGTRIAGWRVRLDRTTEPAAVEQPALRTPPEMTWSAWIDTAEQTDGQWRLTFQRGRPSPVHMLHLQPGEVVRYELSPAPFMRPDVLARIGDLEQFVRGRREDAVGGVLGPTDYVSTVNFMIRGRNPDQRRIPYDVANVARVWREYGNIRGADRLGQLVDPTFTRGIVTILLKNANFVDTARLMRAIRDYEGAHLAPHGISLAFAGDVAVSQTLIEAIVRTETQSLGGALLGVLLVTVILGRSLLFGLLSIIPSAIAVLVNFAFMGWVGMPLGVSTSMFSAMTIGIGVDYAIHLQSRYRRLRKAGGSADDADEATEEKSKSQKVEESKGGSRESSIVDCRMSIEESPIAQSPDHQITTGSGDEGTEVRRDEGRTADPPPGHQISKWSDCETEDRSSEPQSAPLDRRQAITAAVAGTGPAIVVDTLAVALGFGILTLSQVPANAHLGSLVALSIINCVVVTLVVLPAVLAIGPTGRSPIDKDLQHGHGPDNEQG